MRQLLFGQELRDRRARLSVLAVDDVREPLRSPLLRERLELVELGARELLGHAQEANGRRAGEDLELRAARERGRVLDLETEPQVRLVRPEAGHRLGIGQALERSLQVDAERLSPDLDDHPLHQLDDVLDVGERHLHVELRRARSTRSARRSSSRKQRAIWK